MILFNALNWESARVSNAKANRLGSVLTSMIITITDPGTCDVLPLGNEKSTRLVLICCKFRRVWE
jgi:hypothetical protein